MANLNTGDIAPDFSLRDQSGNVVRLSDFRGRRVLIYFYPKASTPGCTIQSCSVRDSLETLDAGGISPLGISPDAPGPQCKFDTKYKLGFPLLCDEDHAVAEAYGAWGEKQLYGKKYLGIIRSSFLIDTDGRLLGAWYKVKPDKTVSNALDALA